MQAATFSEQQILTWARQGYDRGCAAIDIQRHRAALLVIDMQDEFVKPGASPFWVPEATRQIPRIQSLLEVCRALAVPVIFTAFGATHRRQDRPGTLAMMPLANPPVDLDPGEFAGNGTVCRELAPRDDEILILKPSYGAFYDTPLQTILHNLGRDTVIISGTLTNVCCGTTARQAYERGFQVVFGSDINATDLPDAHEAELRVLRRAFARVASCDEIITSLRDSHATAALRVEAQPLLARPRHPS